MNFSLCLPCYSRPVFELQTITNKLSMPLRQLLLVGLVVSMFILDCTAQSMVYSVKILNEQQQPLDGAHLYITEHDELLRSDTQGRIRVASNYQRLNIAISHVGYITFNGLLSPTADSVVTIILKERVYVLDSVLIRPADVWVKKALEWYTSTMVTHPTAAKVVYEEYITRENVCLGVTYGNGFLISSNKNLAKPTWSPTGGIVFERVTRRGYQNKELPYGLDRLRTLELFHARQYWFEFVGRLIARAKPDQFVQEEVEHGLIRLDFSNHAATDEKLTFLVDRWSGALVKIVLENPERSLWVNNRRLWTKRQLEKSPDPKKTRYEVLLAEANRVTQVVGISYQGIYLNGFEERVSYSSLKFGFKNLSVTGLTEGHLHALEISSLDPDLSSPAEGAAAIETSYAFPEACPASYVNTMPLLTNEQEYTSSKRWAENQQYQNQFLALLKNYFQ